MHVFAPGGRWVTWKSHGRKCIASSPSPTCTPPLHHPRLQDLWQYADRDQWYAAKWAGVDMPEWNPARFISSTELAPNVRCVYAARGRVCAAPKKGFDLGMSACAPISLCCVCGVGGWRGVFWAWYVRSNHLVQQLLRWSLPTCHCTPCPHPLHSPKEP